ncbi:NAD-dependent protein deacylase [Staphylococcus devriesei]|uniref:NAD-dependent protein deacylase n=1 Tax=Staphylococcus devriesei TaxID=586733 RepID=UPI003F5B39D4
MDLNRSNEVLILENKIEQLKEIVDKSNRIVFFTGAGVSVASGIPDFRSMGGLFDEISKDGYSPEYLLSIDHLNDDKESFIDFYHKRLLVADKKPNVVHEWIAILEKEGKSLGVITQNIDGLHEDAGSENVDEIHGTLNRFYCISCNEQYSKSYVMKHELRYCEKCGDVIRPDIVLYGEMLDQPTVFRALDKIQKADTVIVLGSSLVVQPAAGFISNFTGDNLVIINRDSTPYDRDASLVINEDMTDVVQEVFKN